MSPEEKKFVRKYKKRLLDYGKTHFADDESGWESCAFAVFGSRRKKIEWVCFDEEKGAEWEELQWKVTP